MAIDIVITQTGLFKKPLTEDILSPAGLRVGHWNQAGVLDDGPYPDGSRVLCDPDRPGRGCCVNAAPGEKNRAVLRQPLACTPRDLELFYGLVQSICKAWGTDRFQQDGVTRRVREIPQLIEEQNAAGAGLLRSMAERWAGDGLRLVTGGLFPIYMEDDVPQKLLGPDNSAFFADYLSKKQRLDAYYAKPNFYRDQNGGEVIGVYAVTETVDSILPLEPFVPPLYYANLQDFNIRSDGVIRWLVSLTRVWTENGQMTGKNIGMLPFARFAELTRLKERPKFDDRHVLVRVDDVGALVEK